MTRSLRPSAGILRPAARCWTPVWWGLYLLAAETGPGLASILGPIFLTFTLTKWSGIGITEKSIHSSRPGYADYVRRTSAFIPWPPKQAG